MIYNMSKEDFDRTMAMWKAGHIELVKPAPRTPTNEEFAKTDELFKSACESVGIKPTARQASKYRLKRGLAFSNRTK